ncbi:hypothetical protein ACFJI0_20495 [Hydrogenophaga sp. UC242_53]|uniref:hypothetical protein n=1 Tax=Hydrogenophaga sp. UC242_53 TaxID=3350170 RepID=UPI0036D28C2C
MSSTWPFGGVHVDLERTQLRVAGQGGIHLGGDGHVGGAHGDLVGGFVAGGLHVLSGVVGIGAQFSARCLGLLHRAVHALAHGFVFLLATGHDQAGAHGGGREGRESGVAFHDVVLSDRRSGRRR